MRTTRTAIAAIAGITAMLGLTSTHATAAPMDPPQPPRHITGKVIEHGADGRPHQLFCPAPYNAYSGGFAISASKGARLSPEPTDVIASRPNANATGWIVTVRKDQLRKSGHRHTRTEPANLVIHLVCTKDTHTHGM